MITLLLAVLNSFEKRNYELLFIGTIILDIIILSMITNYLGITL